MDNIQGRALQCLTWPSNRRSKSNWPIKYIIEHMARLLLGELYSSTLVGYKKVSLVTIINNTKSKNKVNNMNVYLEKLIAELKVLWVGMEVVNMSKPIGQRSC